jgi:acyl-CoA synthetase (AMP-forming)/AMP-acid ligase II
MFLHEMVEFPARRAPGAPALVYGGGTTTFAGLAARIGSVAGAVGSLVPPGARVAMLAENCPAFVDAYYAVPRAGAVLTFLNYRHHPHEWAAMLEHSGSEVLLGERALLDRLGADVPAGVHTVVALDAARAGELRYGDLLATPPADARAGSDTDIAWLIYTSGTTGRPKGAMLTHRSLTAGVTALSIARPVQPDDVYLFPFPLCHVAGYNVLAFHLHGRPVVLMRRFDPLGVVEHIQAHHVTQVSLAPTMIGMLLDLPGLDRGAVPSLRGIGYGASPIPSSVLRRGVEQLGCDFSQGYGMTELSGNVVFLDADDHRAACAGDDALLTAAGRPSPLACVRVVDGTMRDVPVGEVGEIVVRGDQLLDGYWDDPTATEEAFAGGWFHTGDLGRFDARGYLSIVDRTKDVIVSGGENIASREVEEVLARHPAVKDVAVIGVPDPTWGENVCAVVVVRDGERVTAGELVEHCRGHLAGYKKPKLVVFVDALPVNHAGKVLKAELRASVPALVGGAVAGGRHAAGP